MNNCINISVFQVQCLLRHHQGGAVQILHRGNANFILICKCSDSNPPSPGLSFLHLRNSFFSFNAKFSFSLLGKFIFLSTVWLFLQVVVWKRVMEINEELASTSINRALICMGLSLTWLCHPEPKTLAVMAVFGKSHSDTPLTACKSSTDPLDQRWFWVQKRIYMP